MCRRRTTTGRYSFARSSASTGSRKPPTPPAGSLYPLPRFFQHIAATYLVIEDPEGAAAVCLGRTVKPALQYPHAGRAPVGVWRALWPWRAGPWGPPAAPAATAGRASCSRPPGALVPSLRPSGLPPEPEGGLPDRTGNLSGFASFIELHAPQLRLGARRLL